MVRVLLSIDRKGTDSLWIDPVHATFSLAVTEGRTAAASPFDRLFSMREQTCSPFTDGRSQATATEFMPFPNDLAEEQPV